MSENPQENKFYKLLEKLNAVIHKSPYRSEYGLPMFGDETVHRLLAAAENFFIENTPEILQAMELNIATNDEGYSADVELRGMAVKAFAASMIDWFNDTGGTNFVTVDLTDPNNKFDTYAITMQKHMHPDKTPAQRIAELDAKIVELEAKIVTLNTPAYYNYVDNS